MEAEKGLGSGGNSAGSGSTYTNTSDINVGAIHTGDSFTAATTQEMWDALLKQEQFPALSNPGSGFNLAEAGTYEAGHVITTLHFSASFNRGSINPAYGTNGFRSGLPNSYNYTGAGLLNNPSAAMSDNRTINNYTVLSDMQYWTGRVAYDTGEQPLSSYGNPYNSPLPAGQTSSITQSIHGIFPYYTGWIDESANLFDGMTRAEILTLSNMNLLVQTQGNKSVITSPVNGRFAIMYPASYGALNEIIDNTGFDTISDYDTFIYDVVGLDSTTQSYRVYILKNETTQVNFTNHFNF